MKKNNRIQFVNSLILLPFMAGSISLGNISTVNTTDTNQTAFAQKQNIEAGSLFAFNQVVDAKALAIKAQGDAIDAYFKERSMPLEGLGQTMAEEATKNDLDWRLLAAIAVRESSGGKNDCDKVEHNFFGWGSCHIGFDSDGEAIETVARNLGGNNPATASSYADKTTKGILQAYNPPSVIPHYASQVIKIMDAIGPADLGAITDKKAEA